MIAADGTFAPDLAATITPAARVVGDNVDLAIAVTGGTPPYRAMLGDGRLPHGRAISSRAMAITGAYDRASLYRYTVRVYDSANQFVDVAVQEDVGGRLTATSDAGDVVVLTSADVTVTPVGGMAPFTMSVAGGQLPFGRRIEGLKVRGVYGAAARFDYVLRIEDARGLRVDVPVRQRVRGVFGDPVPTPPEGPGPYTPVGGAGAVTDSVFGGGGVVTDSVFGGGAIVTDSMFA